MSAAAWMEQAKTQFTRQTVDLGELLIALKSAVNELEASGSLAKLENVCMLTRWCHSVYRWNEADGLLPESPMRMPSTIDSQVPLTIALDLCELLDRAVAATLAYTAKEDDPNKLVLGTRYLRNMWTRRRDLSDPKIDPVMESTINDDSRQQSHLDLSQGADRQVIGVVLLICNAIARLSDDLERVGLELRNEQGPVNEKCLEYHQQSVQLSLDRPRKILHFVRGTGIADDRLIKVMDNLNSVVSEVAKRDVHFLAQIDLKVGNGYREQLNSFGSEFSLYSERLREIYVVARDFLPSVVRRLYLDNRSYTRLIWAVYLVMKSQQNELYHPSPDLIDIASAACVPVNAVDEERVNHHRKQLELNPFEWESAITQEVEGVLDQLARRTFDRGEGKSTLADENGLMPEMCDELVYGLQLDRLSAGFFLKELYFELNTFFTLVKDATRPWGKISLDQGILKLKVDPKCESFRRYKIDDFPESKSLRLLAKSAQRP